METTTSDADRARHQTNVNTFLADARNAPILAAFTDANLDEDVTDDELIEIVMFELVMSRADVIDRLAKIDFAAVRLDLDHAQALDINARCFTEPLPGGQRYSRNTFKDNGDPILLDANGKRSVFCDLCDDMEDAA